MAGADLKPEDAVLLLAERAQQDDFGPVALRDAAARGQAVLARHHDVEDHAIHGSAREHFVHAARIGGGLDPEAVRAEAVREQMANVPIVVDDQERCGIGLGLGGSVHGDLVQKMCLNCCPNFSLGANARGAWPT